jgi:hypothetical protein
MAAAWGIIRDGLMGDAKPGYTQHVMCSPITFISRNREPNAEYPSYLSVINAAPDPHPCRASSGWQEGNEIIIPCSGAWFDLIIRQQGLR